MTNKTKLSAAALFSALVLGGSFAGSTVFAEDTPANTTDQAVPVAKGQAGPDATTGGSVSEQGHAYVTFTKEGTNPVIDPSTGESLPGSIPGTTGETGELTLDAIPLNLNFGTQEAAGAGQVVNLLPTDGSDTRTVSQGDANKTTDHKGNDNKQVIFTQVTNVATTKPTWSLSATMSDFTNNADSTTKLDGAYITFGGGVNLLNTYSTSGEYGWTPATKGVKEDTVLTAGGAAATFVDSNDQTGTFQQQWDVDAVKLTTPQAPTKGDFSSTIDWTLTVAPANTTEG